MCPGTSKCSSSFEQYRNPTKPIPESASQVNGLYESADGGLYKQDGHDGRIILKTSSLTKVLEDFLKWALRWSGSHDEENEQILLVGYNNYAFDDHVLIHHAKIKLSAELMATFRRKVFTSDLKTILKSKQSLENLLTASVGPSSAADYELHDALYDCCALVDIMETENVTVKRIADCSRSINSVISRKTNPLLRAKLITENVAVKMTEQLMC